MHRCTCDRISRRAGARNASDVATRRPAGLLRVASDSRIPVTNDYSSSSRFPLWSFRSRHPRDRRSAVRKESKEKRKKRTPFSSRWTLDFVDLHTNYRGLAWNKLTSVHSVPKKRYRPFLNELLYFSSINLIAILFNHFVIVFFSSRNQKFFVCFQTGVCLFLRFRKYYLYFANAKFHRDMVQIRFRFATRNTQRFRIF